MQPTTGILLVNLGTPDSYHLKSVFRYLIEFLTDERVIDYPWWKRQLLVRGLIVPLRFRQSAHAYRQLWTEQGSPLLMHGKDVTEKLQKELGDTFLVRLSMRYQYPSLSHVLEEFKSKALEKLIILPLFPQYASATTGSVHQKVMEELKNWTVIPEVTFINNFFDHPAFIDAFAEIGKNYSPETYDHILFSFHGLPERQIHKASASGKCLQKACCEKMSATNKNCYKAQCYATAQLIASKLSIDPSTYSICFQSRLGKDPWIEPYTTDLLHSCLKKGHKKVLVFCPSFVCDCLETTSEIGMEYAEEFIKNGGEKLQLVEGLNSHPAWIAALKQIVKNYSSMS